jgi:hypothetical protein
MGGSEHGPADTDVGHEADSERLRAVFCDVFDDKLENYRVFLGPHMWVTLWDDIRSRQVLTVGKIPKPWEKEANPMVRNLLEKWIIESHLSYTMGHGGGWHSGSGGVWPELQTKLSFELETIRKKRMTLSIRSLQRGLMSYLLGLSYQQVG